MNRVQRVRRSLLQKNGREPTPEEIAIQVEMSADQVEEILELGKEPVSLETPVGSGEGDARLADFIEDEQHDAPLEVVSNSLREERVLRLRFGIGERTDRTLEEVGQTFAVTRERVRQIESKALRKLRHPARQRHLADFKEK